MQKNNSFDNQCHELLRKIPEGRVTTYKEMARALGTKAWRAVGTAMAKNGDLIKTPCHRVVRSNGEIGQYALGTNKKSELLMQEGVAVSSGKVVDLDKYFYTFSV